MTDELYIRPETRNTWLAAGGNNGDVLDIVGTASGAMSEVGSYWEPDQSSTPTGAWSGWYEWELLIINFDPNAVGLTLELYFTTCSETPATADNWDGPPTTAPQDSVAGAMPAVTTADAQALLNNLYKAGSVSMYDAARSWKTSGSIFLPGRFLAPVVYNATPAAVSAGTHLVSLRPTPFQYQV